MPQTDFQSFSDYFLGAPAQKAAASLSDGVEIEFQVEGQPSAITFTRKNGKNLMLPAPARSPQLRFQMNSLAAEQIVTYPSEDLGEIGIHILKMVMRPETKTEPKVRMEICAGFLTLFSKGYFGVLKNGGSAFASFLASKGLNGIGAIKAALSKAMKTRS